MSYFQPPDPPEPDYDAMWEAWFDQQEKNGYAVLSRDDWNAKLDEAASIGYSEGRKDALEEEKQLLAWAYRKLLPYSFAKQEDALAMDEIKLILMGAE